MAVGYIARTDLANQYYQYEPVDKPKAPTCPHCGGRLFLESEYPGGQPPFYWQCMVGCSRQYSLDGTTPIAHHNGKKPRRHVPQRPLPSGALV